MSGKADAADEAIVAYDVGKLSELTVDDEAV